jgi:hypothetical protein
MITNLTQPRAQRVALAATYEGRDPELLERLLPFVDYLEITPETIAEFDGDQVSISPEILAELKNVRRRVGFIVHGVGLSIGSHEGWNPTYFRLLDEILAHLEVAWHSEHLGYTKVDGEHLGIMLAMPKTQESLDMLCARVADIQARYPLPFLLENIVHVIPDSPAPYSDAAFLNALAGQTGCGLILDVYNLECDAHNHGFDISAFLAELDLRHVREMHLACGVEHDGFLLDVHSQLIRPSTVDLAQSVLDHPDGQVQAVTYEFMPEAVPGLGREAIAGEFQRLRAAFNS